MPAQGGHSYVATVEEDDGSVRCWQHDLDARLFYTKECLFSWKADECEHKPRCAFYKCPYNWNTPNPCNFFWWADPESLPTQRPPSPSSPRAQEGEGTSNDKTMDAADTTPAPSQARRAALARARSMSSLPLNSTSSITNKRSHSPDDQTTPRTKRVATGFLTQPRRDKRSVPPTPEGRKKRDLQIRLGVDEWRKLNSARKEVQGEASVEDPDQAAGARADKDEGGSRRGLKAAMQSEADVEDVFWASPAQGPSSGVGQKAGTTRRNANAVPGPSTLRRVLSFKGNGDDDDGDIPPSTPTRQSGRRDGSSPGPALTLTPPDSQSRIRACSPTSTAQVSDMLEDAFDFDESEWPNSSLRSAKDKGKGRADRTVQFAPVDARGPTPPQSQPESVGSSAADALQDVVERLTAVSSYVRELERERDENQAVINEKGAMIRELEASVSSLKERVQKLEQLKRGLVVHR